MRTVAPFLWAPWVDLSRNRRPSIKTMTTAEWAFLGSTIISVDRCKRKIIDSVNESSRCLRRSDNHLFCKPVLSQLTESWKSNLTEFY